MYKKTSKQLRAFLNASIYDDELFSRSAMTTIIRALLEPVANQNASSILFTRFKDKEGLEGLIKRLEYCNNVEMVDVTTPGLLIKDDYVELEFIIFTSARYNFVLIWDYSKDPDKAYTKGFFLANSRSVNDVFEVLQSNMSVDYKEKFYLHKPERRENELLNEALFNVFKKLNNSIEENSYKSNDGFVVDLTDDNDIEEKIKQKSHEIKNQLSVLDVYATILEKQFGKNKNIDVIKKACASIALELNELRNFEEFDIKEVVMQDVVEDAVGVFEEILKQNGNKLVFKNNCDFDVRAFVDYNKFLSVLNNILKNANESTKDDTIEISLNLKENEILIQIENHGQAIPLNVQKSLFEKGFTTKTKGQGIGLYTCREYIKEFRGKIALLLSNEEKTVFEISLPMN